MPAKKIVKKAPAYQPDEEYLHNLVVAEVTIQLEKRWGVSDECRTNIERDRIARISKARAECHHLTCESKKGHYFASWDMAIACALAFVVWLFSSYTIEYIITTILWSL